MSLWDAAVKYVQSDTTKLLANGCLTFLDAICAAKIAELEGKEQVDD